MPKMTKTQRKRALIAIKSKVRKLCDFKIGHRTGDEMTTQDMIAIDKICMKYLKKL